MAMKQDHDINRERLGTVYRIDNLSPTMQWMRLNNVAEAQCPPLEFWQDVESLKQSNRPSEIQVSRMKHLMERYGLLH
jgi:hypothetical protein